MPTEDEILSLVKEVKSELYEMRKHIDAMEYAIREIRDFTKQTKDDMYYVKDRTARIK